MPTRPPLTVTFDGLTVNGVALEMPAPRERLAIHEAGHGVVALLVGLELDALTILPGRYDDGAPYSGHARAAAVTLDDPVEVRIRASRLLHMALGGLAAEVVRYRHHNTHGCSRDLADAHKLALRAGVPCHQVSALIDRCRERTIEILAVPAAWASVLAVAAALLECKALTGAALRDIVKATYAARGVQVPRAALFTRERLASGNGKEISE